MHDFRSVFMAGTVFMPAPFAEPGVHQLECVLYPSDENDPELPAAAEAALLALQAFCPCYLTATSIGLPLFVVAYVAFRPVRLEFGAAEAARLLWARFGGLPIDVLPAEASVR